MVQIHSSRPILATCRWADGKLLWHYPFEFNLSVLPSALGVDPVPGG